MGEEDDEEEEKREDQRGMNDGDRAFVQSNLPETLEIIEEEVGNGGHLGRVVARELRHVGHLVQRRDTAIEVGIGGQQQRK